MSRTRFAMLAAVLTAGAITLSACSGGGVENVANTAAAPETAQEAAPEGVQLLSGTAQGNKAESNTGDWVKRRDNGESVDSAAAQRWVQLSAGKAGALDPVVLDGGGFTLYRFDKDTAKPSKTTCVDECAKIWPPVLLAKGGRVFVDGVQRSAVGTVTRPDGTRQLTLKGWPLYRFNKDLKPGDAKGQGVGGTWFGITPDGKKAGQPTASPTTPAGGRGSAVLHDDANFSDNGASQGLAGPGCQNVARDNVTSSLQISGGPVKIWTEKNCKGKSLAVDADIADLAKVGFDNDISSIFFG
ncbi:hypothetical protein [Crossiella sp. CA198]|uniref:hypothetical protein n=1 Tax=Crossiella sp. CA198 TaxID=3455607 RepID=UPI003F8D2A96